MVQFNDAYKEWRNRARKFDRGSIINGAIDILSESSDDLVSDLEKGPWLTLLMVKWVCQDRCFDRRGLPRISHEQLDDLRQRLLHLPDRLPGENIVTMPLPLFIRKIIRSQLGFQRGLSKNFIREAVLLTLQDEQYPLRKLFKEKTGFDVRDFIDLSIATCAPVVKGNRWIGHKLFNSLSTSYCPEVISSFQSAISRTLPELVDYCRSLPGENRKVASEYFEFPVLARYPLFRRGDQMFCWHPNVLYRGLENFVHSILSEEGQRYIEPFSRLFERHVVAEAEKLPARFFDENALREWIETDTQVPDGLLSFPNCNVFIESKAGLFHESVMTVGSSEIFSHKIRAIKKAVDQAWATCVSLQQIRRAPADVLNAETNLLLIVTNKDLGASRGTMLASMCPEGTIDYPNSDAERILPKDHIYVLSIDDFERLTSAAENGQIEVPEFLFSCVADDSAAETEVLQFEQHLDRKEVSRRYSQVVEEAVDQSLSRLKSTLEAHRDSEG